MALWLCSYVAMWLCGSVAMWLCSYVAIWLCGYVAMWLSWDFGFFASTMIFFRLLDPFLHLSIKFGPPG